MQGDMPTPWGLSQQKYKLADGVYWVSCAGHGGMLVSRKVGDTLLSSNALELAERWGNWYAFEEDCAWALAVFECPSWGVAYKKLAYYEPTETSIMAERLEVCTVCLKAETDAEEMKAIRRVSVSRPGTCYHCCSTRTLYAVPESFLPEVFKVALGLRG